MSLSPTPPQRAVTTSEASLSELSERLQELSDAVAARDMFIAVAAHELRNPMMPIIGQVDLLLAAIRSGRASLEQAEQRLGTIQKSVSRYVKRAVVLLDVSRLNSGQFQLEPGPCDLAQLLRDIADEFGAMADHSGVSLTVRAPACLPGHWDRLAVEQIIDNLLSNAIKYGGRTPVEMSLIAADHHVQLHVRDHGQGVPAEHRRRIFERFERVVGRHEHRSGFGVGLWVVGQLVKTMQGTISIEDAPGGGALFAVELPMTVLKDDT